LNPNLQCSPPRKRAETGSSEIYEPDQPSFGDERATNVLWGRVIALGVVLLLVFFLGRASAGGDSSEEVDTLQNQLAAARAEIDQLQAENRQQVETSPTPAATAAVGTPVGSPGATPSPTGTGGATAERSYTVRSGDTLKGIANRFYGNASYDKCIAQANDIENPSALRVGADITIPPKPAQPCA
jgi:LysM repeat protein